jgi:hypothetical protein
MPTDFSIEYSQRSNDELLGLASQRRSLTTEAAAALDAELLRRNLTDSDRVEYQKFVKRQERREFRGRRRKILGKRRFSWMEWLSAFIVMAVIACAYLALPKRYHLQPDWEEAAVCVMIASVVVIVGWRSLWRDMAFWMALILSSGIQLAFVHTWVQRAGELSRGLGSWLLSSVSYCFSRFMDVSGYYGGASTLKEALKTDSVDKSASHHLSRTEIGSDILCSR